MFCTEIEAGVLGCLIAHIEDSSEDLRELEEEDFTDPVYKMIFKGLKSLADKQMPLSLVSLVEELKGVVLPSNIVKLQDVQVMRSQLAQHIKILKDYALRRKIASFGHKVVSLANGEEPVTNILLEVSTGFFNIVEKRGNQNISKGGDVVVEALKNIETRSLRGELGGIKTGFLDLDGYLDGWQRKDLIFLAGVPQSGKTSLAAQFMRSSDVPALFFTLEMPASKIMERILSQNSMIPFSRFKSIKPEDEDWEKIVEEGDKLYELAKEWLFVEKPGITLAEIAMNISLAKTKYNVDLVIIDHISKIEVPRKSDRHTYAIGEVTNALKNFAVQYDVALICLAHITNKNARNRRPQLGDIRDSSYPEQDADVVLHLWRPELYWPEKLEFRNKAELIIAKQRSGKTGYIWLAWFPEYTLFLPLAKEDWLNSPVIFKSK